MRTLFLFIIICSLPTLAVATLYSCRDSEGRLHVTDNLQSLPAECRAGAREIDQTNPDNLHFVPERSSSPPIDTKSRFQQQVFEQEQRQREQQQLEERLIREAQGFADLYLQAQQERRNAIRHWRHDSRATIERAADQMATAQREKQRLLAELEQHRVPARVSEHVREILGQIVDP